MSGGVAVLIPEPLDRLLNWHFEVGGVVASPNAVVEVPTGTHQVELRFIGRGRGWSVTGRIRTEVEIIDDQRQVITFPLTQQLIQPRGDRYSSVLGSVAFLGNAYRSAISRVPSASFRRQPRE